jgi:hypothetical protein
MRILPRRLLLLGGAVAIAAGGFAYMASNTIAQSNAGEGANLVTGYVVTNITYTPKTNWNTPDPCRENYGPSNSGTPSIYSQTWTTTNFNDSDPNSPWCITGVNFDLTSQTTPPVAPATVHVDLMTVNNFDSSALAYGPNTNGSCTLTAIANATWDVNCTGSNVWAADLRGLDVEANQ